MVLAQKTVWGRISYKRRVFLTLLTFCIRIIRYNFFFLTKAQILAGGSVYYVVEGNKIHAFIFIISTCAKIGVCDTNL